ncbi:hypothetical protein Patl1_27792 [Pistacia atlantica]|uniref:Uncharacterized protein n=1 Tax=Pistacia atlantica TaxID=434234 RepID=A0ACC1BDI5_9ROSI|nr:hypothetical protein Patl1_27792 [Pistacia atlantica]
MIDCLPTQALQLTVGNETLQNIANSSYPANSKTVIYRAALDPDGILRLYLHLFEISGFKYINPGVRNLGCYKSFNEEEMLVLCQRIPRER